MKTTNRLSNLQLELLKVFSFDLDEEQLIEIRDLLAKYFADKATEEMDQFWTEKGWDDSKIEEWSGEHMRTKYESR